MSDDESAIGTLFPDIVDPEATLMSQSTSASEQIMAEFEVSKEQPDGRGTHYIKFDQSLRRGVEKRMQVVTNQNYSQEANSAHPDNMARDCLYKNTRPSYLKAKHQQSVLYLSGLN